MQSYIYFSAIHEAASSNFILLEEIAHVTFHKNRSHAKKKIHFHKTCSYLFHTLIAIYFTHVFENSKIMSKNSSLDLSTSCDFELLVKQCCGIYELIHLSCAVLSRKKQQNIYLPQVLHKAARKRVFETRFLYIEKKKKETISINYQKIS